MEDTKLENLKNKDVVETQSILEDFNKKPFMKFWNPLVKDKDGNVVKTEEPTLFQCKVGVCSFAFKSPGTDADSTAEIEKKQKLLAYIRGNGEIFNFEKLHTDDQWHKLWSAVFLILSDPAMIKVHPDCLNTIRILSRDERSLSKHDVGDDLSILLALAQLNNTSTTFDESTTETVVESLKCLCNLVYQSSDCRRKCVKKNALDAILKRVASPIQFPTTVEFFDMKLLFLLTALDSEARTKAQIDLNGIAYMTEWLAEKLSDAPADSNFDNEEMDVLSEMLKVMFNLTTSPDKSPNENEIQNMHLTGVIRDALLRFVDMNNDRESNIIQHSINLLTNISSSCLSELLLKIDSTQSTVAESKAIPFEGRNVLALDVILRYLQKTLEDQQNSAASSSELLPPILAVLVKCARGHAIMRHYLRSKILPPLREQDIANRPEVGSQLRNHLCRFLTMPAMVLRDLSSELLFVLCKENVRRMIKYTGYGNAAGLFARRGLLDCRRVENTLYSSDSEDSDTEDYKKVEQGINPVLGCYEAPKPSPLEGMSEEQKEYEAMQLVNLMDKLHRGGVVQPCRIGEDGKPVPVDHILELQEELPQQQSEKKQKS